MMVTTASNTFDVTTDYDDMVVSAMNGEMVATTSQFTDHGEYAFPTHVNAFNAINLHYLHNCVNGNCNTYDHISYVRVKNYRGEWVELCRYITPFGVECIDDIDVTDFTSVLQGLVEFEYYSEQYATGDGYNPTAIFEYTKGTPEYPYVDMQEIWYGNYAFGDYSDPCPIPTRNLVFDPCVEKAKLQITTSGHNTPPSSIMPTTISISTVARPTPRISGKPARLTPQAANPKMAPGPTTVPAGARVA